MFGFGRKKSQPASDAVMPEAGTEHPAPKGGLSARLREGLKRTRAVLNTGIGDLMRGRKQIDQELLDELETRLLTADVGVDATLRIIGDFTARVHRHELSDPAALMSALKDELAGILRA
ncbi:MAG: signal recognition particle receptor subunit alpha, partial [Chromatiaceae bacterium]